MVFIVLFIICVILAKYENVSIMDMFKILFLYLLKSITINLFNFNGRTARRGWFIYCSLLGILFSGRLMAGLTSSSTILITLNLVFAFICLIAYFSVTVRRMHDANFTGWIVLAFILFPPLMLMTYLSGTKGSNKYGKDPREEEFGYLD